MAEFIAINDSLKSCKKKKKGEISRLSPDYF